MSFHGDEVFVNAEGFPTIWRTYAKSLAESWFVFSERNMTGFSFNNND